MNPTLAKVSMKLYIPRSSRLTGMNLGRMYARAISTT